MCTSVRVVVLEGKGQRVFILKLNSYNNQTFQFFHAKSDLSLHYRMSQEQTDSSCAILSCQSSSEQLWRWCREVRSHHKASAMGKQHSSITLTPPWQLRSQPGILSISSSCERTKKKGLIIYSPSPPPFFWLLERQCKVLFVQATRSSKLIFYKLNPNKPTSMKIACFKCSQLKTSPALREDFLHLTCIALKLSHFSFFLPCV